MRVDDDSAAVWLRLLYGFWIVEGSLEGVLVWVVFLVAEFGWVWSSEIFDPTVSWLDHFDSGSGGDLSGFDDQAEFAEMLGGDFVDLAENAEKLESVVAHVRGDVFGGSLGESWPELRAGFGKVSDGQDGSVAESGGEDLGFHAWHQTKNPASNLCHAQNGVPQTRAGMKRGLVDRFGFWFGGADSGARALCHQDEVREFLSRLWKFG